MKKDKFLKELLKRAEEQHLVVHDVPFPGLFLFVSRKLGEYPWKILVPVAVGLTIVLHLRFGRTFDDLILWMFGGV